MLLSIIVPVYNMAKDDKLIHCMDSLVGQELDDFEIIAVNDASTDNSLEILNNYKLKYPDKIQIINSSQNQRQGGAKNRGLEIAKSSWIGFVDSDDWISPKMYKKLIDKALKTGADMVGCDYTIVDKYSFEVARIIVNNSVEETGLLDEEKHRLHILKPGSMVVKIYKREVIEANKLRFPENIFYEDNCAASLWSCYFNHFERVNEPLYYYYTVPDSTTHHISWDKCLDRTEAGRILLEESKNRGLFNIYKDELEYKFGELAYAGTLFSYMYSAKNRKLKHTAYLRKMIKACIPDFCQNKYFAKGIEAENRKFIKLHFKSNFLFFSYYSLLFAYRKLIYKKKFS